MENNDLYTKLKMKGWISQIVGTRNLSSSEVRIPGISGASCDNDFLPIIVLSTITDSFIIRKRQVLHYSVYRDFYDVVGVKTYASLVDAFRNRGLRPIAEKIELKRYNKNPRVHYLVSKGMIIRVHSYRGRLSYKPVLFYAFKKDLLNRVKFPVIEDFALIVDKVEYEDRDFKYLVKYLTEKNQGSFPVGADVIYTSNPSYYGFHSETKAPEFSTSEEVEENRINLNKFLLNDKKQWREKQNQGS